MEAIINSAKTPRREKRTKIAIAKIKFKTIRPIVRIIKEVQAEREEIRKLP